jgi:precorrin-3B C17-methyltransferase
MSGRLVIVGLGPGAPGLLTHDAEAALAAASDILGYGPYLARLSPLPRQRLHASDNRQELDRARAALDLAASGKNVALVSGGDSGVFAMASAVFEAIETGEAVWRALDVEVIPGITAMLAASARLGAPLGHDFCAISLSDNLKPWSLVENRLRHAALGDFVIALYNPASRARPWQLGAAFDLLRGILPPTVPVAFAQAISRPEERIEIFSLATADPERANMRTLVIIGARASRLIARPALIERPAARPWLYTPRRASSA